MDEKLQATDPLQYDSPDLDWRIAGAEDNTSRRSFRDALDAVVDPQSFHGKKVLDIGSGVGQLFNWLRNMGVETIVGIDPASRNVETSKELYPWATSIQATLAQYASNEHPVFDAAFACMVFEHIKDIPNAFRDINSLLKDSGKFYLIIGDKDFHLINDKAIRGPKFVSMEIVRDLGNGVVETKTFRQAEGGLSTMYDIFRPLEDIITAAKQNGFELDVQKPMLGPVFQPPERRKILVCHLLVFKKH